MLDSASKENLKSVPKYGMKLRIFLIIASLCHLADSSSIPQTRKGHQNPRKHSSDDLTTKVPDYWKVRNVDETFFPILGNETENEALTHVAFSVGKPTHPPTFHEITEDQGSGSGIVSSKAMKINNGKKKRKRKNRKNKRLKRRNKRKGQKHKHRHGHGLNGNKRRRRRSHDGSQIRLGNPMSACTSMSDWVQISESRNRWGHRVTVLPYLEVGGRRIDQYIYETVCVDPGSTCLGTDRRHFKSECVTKKIYSYAFIRNENGEEGWSLIEINGSCNCKLQRKHRSGPRSLLEHLSNADRT